MNQITEQIRVHVKQDTTEMELQLHPASLGSVKVQLTSAGGVLTAVFTTENEAVKAALESQLIQLKENFSQQGLKVESVEVNVSTQGFERSLDEQEQQQRRFEENRSKKIKSGCPLFVGSLIINFLRCVGVLPSYRRASLKGQREATEQMRNVCIHPRASFSLCYSNHGFP